MKSAYCIAITACLTVIWLYEEKKKRGMAGKLCWKAAAGYLITRFVFFAISNQEVHGFLEVMAMDLVTAGLLYILSGKTEAGNQRGNACIFISGIRSRYYLFFHRAKSGCFLSGWRY